MTESKDTVSVTGTTDLLTALKEKRQAIAVIGLGYVGLPLALELAKKFSVVGFDISAPRVAQMRQGIDPSEELLPEAFLDKDIEFTADPTDLTRAGFYIVAVPTPVDSSRIPNLTPLFSATRTVGKVLAKGDIVVFESTVYPGCTEEDCVPILEQESGLQFGRDFTVGYSPERINPGDKEHTVDKILKIVSGSDEPTLETVAGVYQAVITAGIFRAKSIKVAEAAKVIENSQRDVNISFVNELSMIFKRMDIDTLDVLEAAGTKWNFLPFRPGLVGGHCISVDPYYLLHKSIKLGYDPLVIASGRRINDRVPVFIANAVVKALLKKGNALTESKVLVLGITFKENVADIRNSKVVDVIRELAEFGVSVEVHDPNASPAEVAHEYQLDLSEAIGDNYDAIVVAVGHENFNAYDFDYLRTISRPPLALFDLKGIYSRDELREGETIWRL